MIIKSITFYNTDLDINNENVLNPTFKVTDIKFQSILTELYENYTLSEIDLNVKGVNFDNSKNCKITITKSNFDEIIYQCGGSINYISIHSDEKIYFGFILSFSETGNSIISFNIKYDVWNNNIEKISNETYILNGNNLGNVQSENWCITSKSHIPSIFKKEGIGGVNKYYNIHYRLPYLIENKIINNIKPLYSTMRYSILFLRIIATEKLSIGISGLNLQSDVGSLFTYYIPIGIYDNISKTYVNGTISFNIGTENPELITFEVINGKPKLNYIMTSLIFEYISTKVISAVLTFNTPFPFNVTNGTSTNFDMSSFRGYWSGDPTTEGQTNQCVVFPCEPNRAIYNFYLDNYKEYTIEELKDNTYKNIDVCVNEFPFNYKNLKIIDETPIIPITLYDVNTSINIKNDTDTVGYRITYIDKDNNEEFKHYQFSRVTSPSELSYSRDSLSYYLQTKGATSMIGSILSNSSLLTENVNRPRTEKISQSRTAIRRYKNMGTVAGNMASFGAQIIDAKNAPDTASYNVHRQEIDLDYLDYPYLINYKYVENDITNKSLINNIFLFGYDFEIKKDIFSVSRRYFDYIQTDFIHISFGDNLDREMLIDLFNGGFTRNHIYKDSNGNIDYNVTVSNKNVNNYDMWLESEV